MKERRFIRYVAAIVNGQNPVAVFEHREGHNSLARFSFGVKISQTDKRQCSDNAENEYPKERFRWVKFHKSYTVFIIDD